MDLDSGHTRAPSRAGHRRPPFKRTNASYNAFPDLPPIRTNISPSPDNECNDSGYSSVSSSSSNSDSEGEEFKVDLVPLCTPSSPPSPSSPGSESSISSLFTPLDAEEWERFHDGFPPQVLFTTERPLRNWPATPEPRLEPPSGFRFSTLDSPPSTSGYSGRALYDLRSMLWDRRQRVWWDYEQHCRHLEAFCPESSGSEGDIPATVFFPLPPVLPRSRLTSWIGPNGIPLQPERVTVHSQLLPRSPQYPTYDLYKPIFPRIGDVFDLRDPGCEVMDRALHTIPTYRISKHVYMDEMWRASQYLGPTTSASTNSDFIPDSPQSAYSEDAISVLPQSPSQETSTHRSGCPSSLAMPAHHLETGWRYRWEMLRQRFFPYSVASPPHSPSIHGSPPSPPPFRPGTPIPDDSLSSSSSASSNEEYNHDIEIFPRVDGPHTTSTIPLPLPTPSSSQFAVRVPTNTLAHPKESGHIRPPTPLLRAPIPQPDETPAQPDEEPIVRLPVMASPRARAAFAAMFGQNSASTATSTLADELHRAVSEPIEGNLEIVDDAVRFGIARPPTRRGEPQFSFFTEPLDEDYDLS